MTHKVYLYNSDLIIFLKMKTNICLAIIAIFMVSSIAGQTNLNNYKYIIVPNKFDFLKEENKYRLNELARFLFEKNGFIAVMEGTDYPEDLLFNRCLALSSDVFKEPGVFKTKLKVLLKDCYDKPVYTSQIGESREKEYKTAYTLALREAFESFAALDYKYEPSENQPSPSTEVQNKTSEVSEEIQKLKEEIKTLKEEKKTEEVKPVETSVSEKKTPPVSDAKEDMVVPEIAPPVVKRKASNILYAQATDNGFQLVDSTPKVVYRIINTGLSNVFLVEGKSAILYQKGGAWILENQNGDTSTTEELNIKF